MEERAGIRELDEWGFYNQLHSLSGGDFQKEDYILKLSVYEVFTKIQYISHLNEYRENYQNIVNRELSRGK